MKKKVTNTSGKRARRSREHALRMVGTQVDITEPRHAEERLRASEERYRSLFDRMLDGMYLSTHEGRFVDVNPAFVRMFGYSSKQEVLEIKDIKNELYFLPEERGSQILDTGGEEVEAYRMRRKDGSEIWVEDHGRYVHDADGKVIYHEGILRDITERRRIEEALRESEEKHRMILEELVNERSAKLAESEARYRRLFESSPVAIFEEDFSGVKIYIDHLRSQGVTDLRKHFAEHPEELAKCASIVEILDVNKSALDMYAAESVSELRGELRRLFTHEFQTNFTEEVVSLGEGATRFTSEFDNRTLNGETRHVNLFLTVIPGYESTLAKVLVTLVDLTERKKIEQRLQQAERLAAVGETAAMVGHDLRNPMQGIAGALHLLKQESLTAREKDEMLQVIEKSLEYADSIIRDLSEYAAGIQLTLGDATPKTIIREAIRAARIPPSVIVEDLSEDRPAIRGDVSRLRRVFVNLIENAIDAMPQGGRLTLNSRQLDGRVEIILSDTGSGMSETVAANLWKPFQTTKAKGLGLGLSISKRIVDAHGGKISVESKVGRGTTVTTSLPITPEDGR